VATTVAVLVLGGFVAPVLLLVVAVLPAAASSGTLRPVLRAAVIATLPLAIAVGIVQGLGGVGETVLFRLGPLAATAEGLSAAALVSVRLFVMAAALALFGLTTPASELVADLARRGVSPRLAFAASAILGAVPALVDQARVVRDAQRARGLDIDGDLVARMRGVVPLAAPVVLGTLHGVEQRALALEARAFGRPGRREPLWAPPDSATERVIRWALVADSVLLLVLAATGVIPRLP
jgi:energy-coupling factor transport system permease protein